MQETKSGLLDQNGKPIKREILIKPQVEATTSGVRSPWSNSIARGLTPDKLAGLLKDAASGKNTEFLILAEEMEERYPHYSAVLGQRKRAITLIDPIVTPPEGARDEVVAAIETLVSEPAFLEAADDLMDALAKGYSCVEPMWEASENQWTISRYVHHDPRWFQFDKLTGRQLRIREENNDEGREIPAYSMIIHQPRLKSGLPVRGGLARLVSWAFMLQSFTLQDWAAFLEVFGMPLRVGKYDSNAGPDEKRTLLRAVRDLGSDAAAIIPIGMEIEFIEAGGGQGNAVFGAMADYLDKQVSKAVIGQTMTSDDGSSLAQAQVHNEVKLDIQKSDARQLAATINRDLIAPFVALNFGPDEPLPRISFPIDDPEDTKTLSEVLSNLVPLGLRIGQAEVRKRIGFGTPDEDEEILVAPKKTEADEKQEEQKTAKAEPCPSCGKVHLARQAENIEDELVEEGLSHWQRDMQPIIDQVLNAAESANGYEEFVARLHEIDPDTNQLAKRLAIQSMKASLEGLNEDDG